MSAAPGAGDGADAGGPPRNESAAAARAGHHHSTTARTEGPPDAWPRSAAVFGLGLVGGSVARDLSARGVHVLGHDTDENAARAMRAAGAVADVLTPPFNPVAGVDVVVLAVPVTAAPRVLEALAPHLARVPLVTDAGSTKRGVVAAAERLGLGTHFVGAHPMAGDHRAGWAASRRGLFEGALVYLCPTAQTRGAALAHARALWTLLGADPARLETIDAAAHDRRVAWTSHLPQLAASALARALAERGIPRRELGPGGRDTTRLAGSDPAMWAAIARDNADEISRAVAELERTLAELRAAVDARDEARVRGLLAAARTWAEGR